MLAKMHRRVFIVVIAVMAAALLPTCLWQRYRAVSQVKAVSMRFLAAASKFDLVGLRNCLTEQGRASMPVLYTRIAGSKLRELNRNVQTDVHLSVTSVKIGAGEAKVRVRREVTERGTRFGKPVRTHIRDECTVVCVFDGERWLVDLDRTLASKDSPLANIGILRECRVK